MSNDSPIAARFADLRSRNRMAFMPFVTAGDPDLDVTCALLKELSDRGVDLIEVGFPYSDPIADGPVIQASYTRALERGLQVHEIFAAVHSVTTGRTPLQCPLVAMVAYSIIFRMGSEAFLSKAKQAGFAGLIVPDLPGDEAAEFFAAATERGLDLIQLVAPTTPPQRAERILRHCSGFVYCVSIAGTTGVRDELPDALQQQLRDLRNSTDMPLAVGFGISKPEQVDALRGVADGIIVGSAIVRQVERISTEAATLEDVLVGIGNFAERMVAATHGGDA